MKIRVHAFILAVLPLSAGVRLQVESTDLQDKKTTVQETLIDSSRLRTNMDANSVLFLTDGGHNRVLMLDKARNEYREMDQQTMNQMGQQLQGAMAAMQEQMKNMPPQQRAMMEQMMKGKMPQMGAAPPAKTVYTAKGSGNVNGFACTKYEGVGGSEKVSEVCAASAAQLKFAPADFQLIEKMKEFMSGLQSALANSPFAGAASGANFESGYEGFPVEQVTFRNGQPDHRTQLKSAAQASFSDNDFSLGSAKKLEMPAMGGPGRR